jgi:protein-tyrosine-phosphatase
MEREHRNRLTALFPKFAAKISVLRETAGLSPVDVEDPIGADSAEYEACAASIEEALRIIVQRETKPHAQNTR